MQKQFSVQGKTVTLYGSLGAVPVVYLHTVQDEGASVWEACQSVGCPAFTLAALSGLDWNRDMSPWPNPSIASGGAPFAGGADAHLQLLTQSILPRVEAELPAAPTYAALAGYSLAGLFAVYAAYRTKVFRRIASASGSFWFPAFADFAQSHPLAGATERVYFSLGEREKNARNPLLSTVEERTKRLAEHYQARGIETAFVLNPGNHFTQPHIRMARAIAWLLQ